MAKKFHGEMNFPAEPDRVAQMQGDQAYVEWKLAKMAGAEIKVEATASPDGSLAIRSYRRLPAQVPAAAKKFVGDSIEITEQHSWNPAKADGSRTGKVTVDFGSVPMQITGDLTLSSTGAGSVISVDIVAKASVPIVGGKLESFAGDMFVKMLAKEEAIAPGWLSEN